MTNKSMWLLDTSCWHSTTMPLFLIPLIAGAYLYYEKRKRELQQEEESSKDEAELTIPSRDQYSNSNDHICHQVIETRLSQHASKKCIPLSQQVEVTFGDAANTLVPDRRESEVSADDKGSITSSSISSDGDKECVEMQSTKIQHHSSDVEMVKGKHKLSLRGPIVTSFRKLLFREDNAVREEVTVKQVTVRG